MLVAGRLAFGVGILAVLCLVGSTPAGGESNFGRRSGSKTDSIIELLLEKEAEEFCSIFLDIYPYAATSTATHTSVVDKTLATSTSTTTTTSTATATSTINLGTTTIATTTTTSTESDVTTTTTDTVTTIPSTTIFTESDTSTSDYTNTAAPTIYAGRKRWSPIPPWLPYAESEVSSACSHIVTRKTKVVSATVTQTATETAEASTTLSVSTTVTATSIIPQQTSTDTDTVTSTSTGTVTSTITATATTTTTTTSTAYIATATACAQPFQQLQIDVYDVSLDAQYYNEPDAESCCVLCFQTNSCAGWSFGDYEGGTYNCAIDFGSMLGSGSGMCAYGYVDLILLSGSSAYEGGTGPCAGTVFIYTD